tara:strand:+ start:236 stop:634 length:399 start_codon:yes stop_codon:yes gene_type:complete
MATLNEAVRSLLPNKGWRISKPEPTNEEEFNGRFEIQTGFNDSMDAVYSSTPSDFGITWSQVQSKMSELDAAQPLNDLREMRNILLAQTDWWAGSDLTMTSDQTSYRQALRDITKTYSSMDDEGFSWPTKPS